MLGPISKVQTSSKFDALAEIPLVGTVSSAVSLSVNVLSLIYNILRCPVSTDRGKCLKNMKIAVIQIGKALAEIMPLLGNFVAVRLNKKEAVLRKFYEDIDARSDAYGKNKSKQKSTDGCLASPPPNLASATPKPASSPPKSASLSPPSKPTSPPSNLASATPNPASSPPKSASPTPKSASPTPKSASPPTNPASSQANSSPDSSLWNQFNELNALDDEIKAMAGWNEAQLRSELEILERDPCFAQGTMTDIQTIKQTRLINFLDDHRMLNLKTAVEGDKLMQSFVP